jgi:2,4-dienoyl-CoA reductase-like NADH-dependent reductase (Old Yellow Enzyme family)
LRPERLYVVPRPLETDEVVAVVEAIGNGAENAMAAGFDGLEIRGAIGYVLEQFTVTVARSPPVHD